MEGSGGYWYAEEVVPGECLTNALPVDEQSWFAPRMGCGTGVGGVGGLWRGQWKKMLRRQTQRWI